ncbi:MAG TPA: hypothetical protein VLK22_03555 [Candidatus Udaeobacter sp.]|nr:hypothetical protein [Candidatus Udaeobacter sp.]
MTTKCACVEGKYDSGFDIPEIIRQRPPHNCEYIKARNALIEVAEIAADRAAPGQSIESKAWARAFHQAMNRLAYEGGLTTTRPLHLIG